MKSAKLITLIIDKAKYRECQLYREHGPMSECILCSADDGGRTLPFPRRKLQPCMLMLATAKY